MMEGLLIDCHASLAMTVLVLTWVIVREQHPMGRCYVLNVL